jgi:hypothetical protein
MRHLQTLDLHLAKSHLLLPERLRSLRVCSRAHKTHSLKPERPLPSLHPRPQGNQTHKQHPMAQQQQQRQQQEEQRWLWSFYDEMVRT